MSTAQYTSTKVKTPVQHTAFKNLKVAFVSKLVLLIPDYLKPFEMKCDALLFATGGVLLQKDTNWRLASHRLSFKIA